MMAGVLLCCCFSSAAAALPSLEWYMKASNAAEYAVFGSSLAYDNNTLAIGAPGESSYSTGVSSIPANDTGNSGSGAVYVFTSDGTNWGLEAYLKSPFVDGGAFGSSVALLGDTLAVGATEDWSCTAGITSNVAGVVRGDNNCYDIGLGAVHVFRRSGTTWSYEAYMKPTKDCWGFGYAIVLGNDMLAIGTIGDSTDWAGIFSSPPTSSNDDWSYSTDSGAVYICVRSGTTWSIQAFIKREVAPWSRDNFGFSLAISGETLAVGSFDSDYSQTVGGDPSYSIRYAGAVYVYDRNFGTSWSFSAFVKAPNPHLQSWFGCAISISEDVLVVGAYGEQSCATGVSTTASTDLSCGVGAGAAYVYSRIGTNYTFEAYLKPPNTASDMWFAWSLWLDGDRLVVGAGSESSCTTAVSVSAATDQNCTHAGAAYVFSRFGSSWTYEAYLKAPNAGANDQFAVPTVVSGDTAFLGAPYEDSCSTVVSSNPASDDGCWNVGAVYTYTFRIPPPSPPAGPIASVTGDPHLQGAHGDRADFKGEDRGIYVVLSTHDLSLAMGVEHASFFTPHSKLWVHGSWVRHAYWTVRTSRGRLLHVHLNALRPKFNGSDKPSTLTIDDVNFDFNGHALVVTTATWRTKAEVTRGKPHYGQLRINLAIQPLYDVASGPVAPHGLLGQTYDGDARPLHGKRDRYDILDDGRPTRMRTIAGGRITLHAKAEGAIEGNAKMYRIRSPFDTNFTFSRFGVLAAAPRNVTKLHAVQLQETQG